MKLAINVPALNEAAYLPGTLDSLHAAAEWLRARPEVDVEIIVVDNDSEDETAAVARAKGATVVREPVRSIARARNTGARRSAGEVLVFIDADVSMPPTVLGAIHAAMSDRACVGGGVDVDYHPRRLLVRIHLRAWRLLGRATGMVQGAAQFCRASVFEQVGGYDEGTWIGGGRRFLLEAEEAGSGNESHRAADPEAARRTLLPALRSVAPVEDSDLDQPDLHRAVPALETSMERLVLRCGAVAARGPLTAAARRAGRRRCGTTRAWR